MADTITRVEYFYVETAHKAGEGARTLGVLKDAGVNLWVKPADVNRASKVLGV